MTPNLPTLRLRALPEPNQTNNGIVIRPLSYSLPVWASIAAKIEITKIRLDDK
jgi:hypothetical protein